MLTLLRPPVRYIDVLSYKVTYIYTANKKAVLVYVWPKAVPES
jgi:hypothetical protein